MNVSQGELSARYTKLATGHVCDALEREEIHSPTLSGRFHPLTLETHFAGPVVTLRLLLARTPSQSRRLAEFLDDVAYEGCVLLLDAGGVDDVALFGGRAAIAAKARGVAAVVVNGSCRDVSQLQEVGLPVHATGRALRASEGRVQGVDINSGVGVDGVLVQAGDWLVGDESGICVVPAALVDRVLVLAEDREHIDRESTEQLRAGRRMSEAHRHFTDDDIESLRRTE